MNSRQEACSRRVCRVLRRQRSATLGMRLCLSVRLHCKLLLVPWQPMLRLAPGVQVTTDLIPMDPAVSSRARNRPRGNQARSRFRSQVRKRQPALIQASRLSQRVKEAFRNGRRPRQDRPSPRQDLLRPRRDLPPRRHQDRKSRRKQKARPRPKERARKSPNRSWTQQRLQNASSSECETRRNC